MLLGFNRWKITEAPLGRLLFLHGMGGTGALWRPIAASLEDSYDILAPDQRGHGMSLLPQVTGGREVVGYTPLDYGRDAIETMENLHFHPAWLIGHSMGVRTACAIAHLKPEWVQGLVLIDMGLSGVAGGGLGEGLAQFLRILPQSFATREAARMFMNEHCPDPSIAQYLMAVSRRGEDGAFQFPFDHGALIQTITAARDVSVREWLRAWGKAGRSALLLRGANSLVWSAQEYAAEKKIFADLPTIAFEEFEGAGHGLPFEQRLRFVARLREWVEQSRAMRGNDGQKEQDSG